MWELRELKGPFDRLIWCNAYCSPSNCAHAKGLFSQNHRILSVVRDPQGSLSATPGPQESHHVPWVFSKKIPAGLMLWPLRWGLLLVPNHPLGEESFPDIQTKPILTHLQASPSGRVTGQQREEIGACLSSSSPEEFVTSMRSLLQAEQTERPQLIPKNLHLYWVWISWSKKTKCRFFSYRYFIAKVSCFNGNVFFFVCVCSVFLLTKNISNQPQEKSKIN